jgi:hypothetical protein
MESLQAKVLDKVRCRIRVKGYSVPTGSSYASWVRRLQPWGYYHWSKAFLEARAVSSRTPEGPPLLVRLTL